MLKITYLAWPAPGAPSVIRDHRRMAGGGGRGGVLTSRLDPCFTPTHRPRHHAAILSSHIYWSPATLLLPAPLQAGSIYILEI